MNQSQLQPQLQPQPPPQFIIQANQPGQSGWDKAMGYSASCGKFVGISGAVVCSIIIIVLCWLGIYLYRKKTDISYNTVQAKILEATCSQVINDNGKNKSVSYNCLLKVSYTVNNTEYTNTLESNDTVHNVGEIREIYYNITNPNDIKYLHIESKFVGKIFIGIGSSFVLLLIIHIVLTMKSEWYNRLQCVGAVSSAIRG